MTEIWPFAGLVVLQIPLPLSNIFMLCICVGTDIYPALSLAYQEAEVDIMTRKPRKPTEHMVTLRLLAHAYGQMGEIATAAAFFTYFVIMEVYGFSPQTLFFLLSNDVMLPISSVNTSGTVPVYTFMDPNNADFTYTFNASQTGASGTQGHGVGYFGSTNIASPMYVCDPANKKNAFSSDFPNWLSTINAQIDLRAFYVECQGTTPATYYYKRLIPDQNEVLGTLSSYTGAPVAYTTEALYYAQSGYFVTVVMVQWSNVFACKSRKCSLIYSGVNKHMFGGIACETVLIIVLLYIPGINGVFGGRRLDFFLLGIPGLLFSMTLLIWEETRKMLLNMNTNNGNPNWWSKNLLW